MNISLRTAIDQDIYRIDDEQYTDADFKAMSIDELENMKLRISKKISGISSAISNKKMDGIDSGDKASREWLKSHRAALSINERVSAYVKGLISKRIRKEKSVNDYFVRHAKVVLNPELFDRLMTEARLEVARSELT